MAVLYITEFANQGRDANGLIAPIADEPPAANQTVAIGGASVASSAFNALTKIIRVHTDVVCSIEIGTAPTATTTTRRMAANSTEYFSVPLGASYKIAVIANT
jgi:hypothetical protein